MINETIIKNSPGPANSKMWSAFIGCLKLLDIYVKNRLFNCQLIPVFFGFECRKK